jgi:hypothetical protein
MVSSPSIFRLFRSGQFSELDFRPAALAGHLNHAIALYHSAIFCVTVDASREVFMRLVCFLPILLSLFTCSNAPAQEPAIVPDVRPVGPQKSGQQFYAEDGGAHGGILESIVIPPKLNAPFTLLLETEWVRELPDGGSITTINKRRIARDTEGRIYMERWFLVPKGRKTGKRNRR